MKSGSLATWAELLQFQTIWIVAAVLLSDVVAFFAVNACHSDLRADIRALAGHGDSLLINYLSTGAREYPASPHMAKKRASPA